MDESQLTAKFQRQWKNRENEYKRQKALLDQKIEFLELELSEFKQKDQENRKLNESIIMTYKNNEQLREQNTGKISKDLIAKHANQLQSLRNAHAIQVRRLESELASLEEKLEKNQHNTQRVRIQCEQRIADQRKKIEEEYLTKREEDEREQRRKLTSLESKLKKAENTIRLYKEHIQKMTLHSNNTNILQDRSQLNNLFQYSFLLDPATQNQRKSAMPRQRPSAINILAQQEFGASVKQSRKSVRPTESILNFLNPNNTNIMGSHNVSQMAQTVQQQHSTPYQPSHMNSLAMSVKPASNNNNNNAVNPSMLQSTGGLSRRQRSQSILQTIQSSQTKSRKYLLANKENLDELTSRISRAVSSLEKNTSKSGIQAKKIQHLRERIQKKLRIG